MAELYVIFFIIIVVTVGVMQYLGHGILYGDPRLLWIAVPLLILFTIDSWKDKKELVKRSLIALPFALLFVLLMKIESFGLLNCFLVGILLLEAMILQTSVWKIHFIITLICATVLFVMIILLKKLEFDPFNTFVIVACALGTLIFFQSYRKRLKQSNLESVSIRSIRFAGLCLIAFASLTISHFLCRQHQIGFAISFGISILVALGILGLSKLLKI